MKLRYFFPLIVSSAMILGCNKALDQKPLQEISDVSFWNTADQFKLAVNEFYTYQRTFSDVINDNPHAEIRADLITGAAKSTFSNGTNIVPLSDANYNQAYNRLRSVNYMLDKSAGYPNPGEIAGYVAQAKFFRAYLYFDLLQQFGDVPLILKLLGTQSEELQQPRTSRAAVLDQIVKDLEEAIAVLPVESAIGAADKGRVSKGAAQSFLSRVTLYEGTWLKFRNGDASRYNALLDKSIANANAVISSNEYYLFGTQGASAALADSSQKYMFILEDTKSNPASVTKSSNREYILSNRYDQNTRQLGLNITQAVTNNATTNWVTRKFASMYLCQDGLPIEKSPLFRGYSTTRSEFTNRDNRMRYNLMADGNYYWDNKAPSSRINWLSDAAERAHSRGNSIGTTGTGYANQKYTSERLVPDAQESYDYPVIRYAEVLINLAEATFERNNTISDADLDRTLNLVRNRVNKSMPKLSNGFVTANGLDMRNEIRRERTIELYFEGFRLDDLKRWKTAEIEMPQPIQGITWTGQWQSRWTGISGQVVNGIYTLETGRTWSEKNYLLPIPSQQRQLNPNLTQNPGW